MFFRDNTRRRAVELGLTGWVRNLYDGRVEVVAEGEKPKVEALIAWLKVGPPLARVENMDIRWEEYTGEFQEFRIARVDF